MTTTADMGPGLRLEDLRLDQRRTRRNATFKWAFFGAALFSIVISALIVFSLLREAWTFMVDVDWSSVWSTGWFPRQGVFDVKTLFVASLLVTGIAMVVAVPIGLASAVYLSEYARPRVRALLKPILEILAGIPSVVLGFFALVWIAPNVVANIGGSRGGSLMAAGIGVGLLSIPLVASVSEDAMAAVPRALREASAGLGARKMTTTLQVVLPAAASGLVAALIIAVSRALGETMVVFIAGGGADQAPFTANPFDGSLTMTAAMASLAGGSDQVVGVGLAYQSLFFVGLLLFLITFGLNIVAGRFVRRVREAY